MGGQNVAYDDVVHIARRASPGETVWYGGDLE
jgi:hypothetical protein